VTGHRSSETGCPGSPRSLHNLEVFKTLRNLLWTQCRSCSEKWVGLDPGSCPTCM